MEPTEWVALLDADDQQFDIQIRDPGVYEWQSTPQQQLDCEWLQQTPANPCGRHLVIPQGFVMVKVTDIPIFLRQRWFTHKKISNLNNWKFGNFLTDPENWCRKAKANCDIDYCIDYFWVNAASIVWIETDPDVELSTYDGVTYANRVTVLNRRLSLTLVADVVQLILELSSILDTTLNLNHESLMIFEDKTPDWRYACLVEMMQHGIFFDIFRHETYILIWLGYFVMTNNLNLILEFLQQTESLWTSQEGDMNLPLDIDISSIDMEILELLLKYGFQLRNQHMHQIYLANDDIKIQSLENLGLRLDRYQRRDLTQKTIRNCRSRLYPNNTYRCLLDEIWCIYEKFREDWTQAEMINFLNMAVLEMSMPLTIEVVSRLDVTNANRYLNDLASEYQEVMPNLLSDMIWYSSLDIVDYVLQHGVVLPENSISLTLYQYFEPYKPTWSVAEYLIREKYCSIVLDTTSIYWSINHNILDFYNACMSNVDYVQRYLEVVALIISFKNTPFLKILADRLYELDRPDLTYRLRDELTFWQKRFMDVYCDDYGNTLQKLIDRMTSI